MIKTIIKVIGLRKQQLQRKIKGNIKKDERMMYLFAISEYDDFIGWLNENATNQTK